MTKPFSHFVGIDWSGAKGKRHKGIAVAVCAVGNQAPKLIDPPSGKAAWSREECRDWILAGMGLLNTARALVGLDSAFSMPFVDEEQYLGDDFDVPDVRQLWKAVEKSCANGEDLFGGPFVDANAEYYHRPGAKGVRFSRRMRVTEDMAVASKAGPCESVYHLIGPSQVGLSGLSTMRMLSDLADQPQISVWPYDEPDAGRITLVEIYAAAFAALGGHRGKFRTGEALNSALRQLGSKAHEAEGTLSDHASDAIITAAALRKIAPDSKYWHPSALSTKVRRTEGWVFGIV
jgi:hypothetical protein